MRRLGLTVSLILVAVAAQAQQPAAIVSRAQFTQKLVAAALGRPKHEVTYDPGYVGITYPGGDVPENSGVCSDEIIRIYRAVGIDLQKEVHEDIVRDPSAKGLFANWWAIAEAMAQSRRAHL